MRFTSRSPADDLPMIEQLTYAQIAERLNRTMARRWWRSISPNQKLHLARPPRAPGEKPWWDDDYTVAHKIKDRALFS